MRLLDRVGAEAPEPDWRHHWRGMPAFRQRDLAPVRTVEVKLRDENQERDFEEKLGQRVPRGERYTPSLWHPEAEIGSFANKRWVSRPGQEVLPRYPVYVPTKGRWEKPLTIRMLLDLGVPFKAVVEAQEADAYAEVVGGRKRLLILPHRDKGLVAARNWIWDHAEASGAPWFWTFDDNIEGLYRLHLNLKTPVATPAVLRIMERFAERYDNVPILGMNYFMFASRKSVVPAFYPNTRVYSNMLIRTRAPSGTGEPYRNEGFFNDDTDLCLRVLKDGNGTVLFNAFLILKQTTMTVKGGMTPYYQGLGRLRMAMELVRKHPDVAKLTRKWGRWQHVVDYRPFAGNELRLISDPPEGVDEQGLALEVDGEIVDDPADHLPGGRA